ncbi:hypothetical protein [Comamonas sp. MYb396]|uniref:hypothetical protein n=1 Tax=Comamonas sp. MYb396 TaxID=2745302 RepID=UPI00309BDF8B
MKVVARKVFPDIQLPAGETDVFDIRRQAASLEIIVKSLLDDTVTLHISFPHYEALLEADEGNHSAYWCGGQFKGGIVYEIAAGGLLSREQAMPGLLTSAAALSDVREWFIATSGSCVSVVSTAQPSCLLKSLGTS